MVSFVRKYIFAGRNKSGAAPHIFLVLCFYSAFTTAYTGVFFNAQTALIRLLLCLCLLAAFVAVERSRLSTALTAFLAPTLIAVVIIFGAVYFKGDGLLFIYLCCIAFVSLTYFDTKGLAAHIVTMGLILLVLLFILKINLLGVSFSMLYNAISYVACMGLCVLIYILDSLFAKMLKALTEARNEATLAAKAKGDFLAKMSHEIRTPLNAILGLTEAGLRKNDSDSDMENLRKIHSSGNLLLGIINDILDMSKIESGRFELVPEEYDFADMIYDTAAMNMVRIGSKNIDFVISIEESIPRRLHGDALRIKQLLNNLLSNAFKYTPVGRVELRADWKEEGGDARIYFEVADTGVGIAEKDLKGLFSEYFRAQNTIRNNTESTGLGLSISKGLVSMMDGNISAAGNPGGGSIFSADIRQGIVDRTPIGIDTAGALSSFSYLPQNDEAGMDYIPMPYAKVLIVDDVDINLTVAAFSLEPYGIEVDCADSGAEAVRKVSEMEKLYDLLFMDQMMPGMDGIEATRAIRALGTDYAERLPIIALTANALTGAEKMFLEHGFQGFLAKPIEKQKLDAVLRKWVYDPAKESLK